MTSRTLALSPARFREDEAEAAGEKQPQETTELSALHGSGNLSESCQTVSEREWPRHLGTAGWRESI